jgi:hypothetical protein
MLINGTDGGQMKKSCLIVLAVLFVLLTLCCNCLWAVPTTAEEADKIVTGWLKADPKPLGTSLGWQVKKVDIFTDDSGNPIYYIVYLHPTGFVIVSADDLVEPIIAFVQGENFDPSPENPLGALVTNDLNGRIAAVRSTFKLQTIDKQSTTSESQSKWRYFIDLADKPKEKITLMDLGDPSISDVRVAPLIKSKWNQQLVCGLLCYNYYTPNNYPCGCPATTMAQLIRYFEYPTIGIGLNMFQIKVDGNVQMVSTRGGDGYGGSYNWDLMPYEPNCSTTEVQRQAIGALCYDAGISMNQSYRSSSSGWGGSSNARMKEALNVTFKYANAVHGYNFESPIGPGLIGMINPNLDAKKPVILGTVPHAFICDGYGYIYTTLYHHLNMGWSGSSDAWYNLINSILSQGLVCSCVYNVQTIRAGDCEIISGRVFDYNNEEPIANAVLYVKSASETVAETRTDSEGIYAFDCLQSNTTYTVTAVVERYGSASQDVTTGISTDDSVVSGNVWGVDFVRVFYSSNQTPTSCIKALPSGSFLLPISPADTAIGVSTEVVLQWKPWYGFDSYDLYFGTDFNDVSSADSSWPMDTSVYKGNLPVDINSYVIYGLESDTTYYWRVDMNSQDQGNNLWKGRVWSFSTSKLAHVPTQYPTIQEAIELAWDGVTIAVSEGTYTENINFKDKSLTIRSTDPNDPTVVRATVIEGRDVTAPVVFVTGDENTNCAIAGLTIRGGRNGGIYCDGVSPVISNCFITGARSFGIRASNLSCPVITNCCIVGSGWFGIEAFNLSCPAITNCCIVGNKDGGVRIKDADVGCTGTIKNCTIAANGEGVWGIPIITNSIIWGNSSTQVAEPNCIVTYSDIQDGFPGEGNINADPCFADPNSGDYHLKSQAGRWDPISESWVIDGITSLCIDAGDPNSPVGNEPSPNGRCINIGAYGGTSEASKSEK